MRLFLAGLEGIENYDICSGYIDTIKDNFYWLGSFYYLPKNTISCTRLENFNKENFLLDSGAFTFISKGLNTDINKYTLEYIDFINKYDIKYFFEMDIDTILGYKKVKELRETIEKNTGKKCIPVWHRNRGIEEFKKHCEEYNYIAIGGLAIKELKTKKDMEIVKQLIKYANSKNVKIHLLGYNKSDLIDYNAYSCDATSWNAGRFGGLWNWDNINQRPKKINRNKERRTRSDVQKEVYLHNLKVWKHYQDVVRYKGYWRE